MRLWFWVVIIIVLPGVAGCGGDARYNRRNAAISREELLDRYPWLAATFEDWTLEADLNSNPPGYAGLAAYPVGNGRCFGFEGTQYPLNALSNLIGPDYQKSGALWASTPVVYVGGKPVLFTRQRVAWVKAAPVVTTSLSTEEGLRLESFDFASPDHPCIVRVLVISNKGSKKLRSVALGITFNLAASDLNGDAALGTPQRQLRAGIVGSRTQFNPELSLPELPAAVPRDARPAAAETGSGFVCPLGSLKAGQSVAKVAYLIFSDSEQAGHQVVEGLEVSDAFAELERCRQAWADEFGDTVQVTCPDSRVSSMLEVQKRIIASQQASAGGFSPMDKYTYCWVRDSNGPIRYMLALGAHERVRKALDYHYRGSAQQGKIGNNLPLNLNSPEPSADYDWSEVPVEPAEVPSFVVLQRYWYMQHSGDVHTIGQQMGMLRRCIEGQEVDERGRLPFHADETYRFPGYSLFNAGHDVPDYVSLEAQSADSGFEYCAADKAIQRMVLTCAWADGIFVKPGPDPKARRAKRALEDSYWHPDKGFYAPAMSDFSNQVHRYPFAPINMRPIWIGYGDPADKHQQQNVLNSLKYLWKENGTVTTTPSCGYYVTMTPGYVLYNLAAIGHPAAEKALEGVLTAAEASGGYAEMNTPEDRPSDTVWGKHRIRPWEGGINAEAMLYYLTGFEPYAPNMRVSLCPQMPLDWDEMRVENLRVGNCRLSLEIKDGIYTLTRADDGVEGPLIVNLTVRVAGKLKRLLGNWRECGGRQTGQSERYGLHWLTVERIKLWPASEVQVALEYSGTYAPPEPVLPVAESFTYGPCQVPGGVDTVVLTWSKETAKEYERELGNRVLVLDTKLAWPAEYLRSALLRDDGSARVKHLITDLTRYAGAFKTVAFWSDGAGGQVIEEFIGAGGTVAEHPSPRELPAVHTGQVAQQIR